MAKLLLICSVCLIRRFLMLLVDDTHPDADPDPNPRVRTVRVVLSEVGGVAGCRRLVRVEIVNVELRHGDRRERLGGERKCWCWMYRSGRRKNSWSWLEQMSGLI